MAIDVHAHFVPPAALAALARERRHLPSIEWEEQEGRVRFRFPKEPWTRPMHPTLTDLEERLAWMQTQGITEQWLSGWLDIFGTGLPHDEASVWCRLLNESLYEAIQGRPEFRGVATVPIQDPEEAARALNYAVDALNFCAVTIPTYSMQGIEMDDPRLNPFWEVAADRQIPVLVHPGYAGGEERLAAYELANTVGRIAETTLAVTRMIYGGVFQRHPQLSVILMHGGGFLPYQMGRLHQGFAVGRFGKESLQDPEQVLPRLYYDSLVFRPEALRFLVEVVGKERVVLGSDYPFGKFALGDAHPLDVLAAAGYAEDPVLLYQTAVALRDGLKRDA